MSKWAEESKEIEELQDAVRSRMSGADPQMVQIVTAVAGLLSAVAYADREHSAAERAHIREQLVRIEGLDERGVEAILEVLDKHVVCFSTTLAPRFTRTLVEETSVEMRREVLDVALGVAAADGTISHHEITTLRNLTGALGLSQADYNYLQSKYREYLHFV